MKTRRNTNRRSSNRSSNRSKKGGFGGWPRTTAVGPAWDGQNGGNHFKFGSNGVVVGGISPAVTGNWGPGMHQINRLVPHLSQKSLSMGGGSKRSRSTKRSNKKGRSRRGGLTFGGLPDNIKIGWDGAKNALQNGYRGFMGVKPLESSIPWHQKALSSSKMPNTHAPKPYVINAVKNIS